MSQTVNIGKPSIVAIHGLGGHFVNTWTRPGNNGKKSKKGGNGNTGAGDSSVFWLRDLLPEKFPNARIMTYKYESKILRNKSKYASVSNTARALLEQLLQYRGTCPDRPIVFIVHSLGGLVAKQVSIPTSHPWNNRSWDTRSNDITFKSIADATKGLIFFGTPHRGSDLAKTLGPIQRISSLGFWKSSAFTSLLQTHSDGLLEISEDFRTIAPRYALITFYEQHIHPYLRDVIVDKMSAVMGMPHEQTMMLAGDHNSMCKLSRGDPRFDTVWMAVRTAAKGPPAARRHAQRAAA
ncbi:protein SERAC1 [Podospora aff. communis PSN243]|uniref:Protein SERAC1 n=1 Tax=Podospora aff. communis PSN243 TaxID=3040156 RepID=A0AAV9GRG4_9PEZI|nr:protein SERAC1 [Podospora aff. communis PSN243]